MGSDQHDREFRALQKLLSWLSKASLRINESLNRETVSGVPSTPTDP